MLTPPLLSVTVAPEAVNVTVGSIAAQVPVEDVAAAELETAALEVAVAEEVTAELDDFAVAELETAEVLLLEETFHQALEEDTAEEVAVAAEELLP